MPARTLTHTRAEMELRPYKKHLALPIFVGATPCGCPNRIRLFPSGRHCGLPLQKSYKTSKPISNIFRSLPRVRSRPHTGFLSPYQATHEFPG